MTDPRHGLGAERADSQPPPVHHSAACRRRLIEAALRRHGILSLAAQRVRAIGHLLREETRLHGLEFAALLDAQTGGQLLPIVSGDADEVDTSPLLRETSPGRAYVGVHTHPRSQPFSLADIALLLAQPAIHLVVAVGRDGSWYLMSVAPNVVPGDIGALRAVFAEVAEATIEQYRAPPYRSIAAARRAHLHAIWEQVSPRLGLQYDWIEGAPKQQGAPRQQ